MSDMTSQALFKIQIEETHDGAVLPEMAPEKFINATQQTLSNIAEVIDRACAAFIERINVLDARPNECGIEFGVNASGEAGVPFVTKGTMGANFKVSLKWSWE